MLHAPFILLDLITLVIFDEEYKLGSCGRIPEDQNFIS
jgi:hypothetical protein